MFLRVGLNNCFESLPNKDERRIMTSKGSLNLEACLRESIETYFTAFHIWGKNIVTNYAHISLLAMHEGTKDTHSLSLPFFIFLTCH